MSSHRAVAVLAPLVAGAALLAPTQVAATTVRSSAAAAGASSVVVMATDGQVAAVERSARRLGLRVTRQLPIVHGFAARGPDAAAAALGRVAGVVSVSPDRRMTPMSIVPSLGYDPADTGSLSAVGQIVGAQAAWAKGYTGAGVDVAVIDTGVTPVAGLSAAGKVVTGPDLSFDAPGAVTPGLDAFGHGTFMAGIIAGRDDTATSSATGCTTCLTTSGYSDTTKYVGVAPDARIVNVKVGAADGATDVSQVIAAIDWVTQHAHDSGLNIKVLNLSFGTQSTQSYLVDPLAQAAEQAWKHGIVVVAAAGNEGSASTSLADPAYDPYLLAVGGDDPLGTLTTADDVVPSFAQHGTLLRPVDVLAPASHVLGLRVPGSYIDRLTTNTGQVGTRFQRGSGTSEATAAVSGVVALLAQRYPTATPDALKALLNHTAVPLATTTQLPLLAQYAAGNGIVNAGRAVSASLPASTQLLVPSTGSGTLDGSRGGVYVSDNGVDLKGQQDIFGHAFVSSTMATAQASATSWSGGIWNGIRWTGDAWSGIRWSTAVWTGTDWAGIRWSGSRWTGMSWDGIRWSGSSWSGARWTGTTWTGARWSSASWN